MRILIATGLYPPEIGGPATYTKLLEEELPKHGFAVFVAPFSAVRRWPKVLRHFLYFCKVFAGTLRADIVFAQDPVSVGLPALFAARLMRKRFVIRVAGDYAWEQAVQRFGVDDTIDDFQQRRYGWRIEMLRRVECFVVRNADLIITPSNYFNRLVSGWLNEKDGKVVTIYNGIYLPEDRSVEPQPNTIISAGRLVPWKGFNSIIKLLAEMPGWEFRLVGDGPEQENLEEMAQRIGVRDRVHFLGSVPREELLQELRGSLVFVLNSSFESFSFQLVEAMAVGVPVVAANIGNIAEIVTDKENGLLVPPDDSEALHSAIQRIADDVKLRRYLIANAKERAKDFSVDRTVTQLIKELNNL